MLSDSSLADHCLAESTCLPAERGTTGKQPISGDPELSPFSPELRLNAGRAAMVGFSALLVWEKLYGTAFFA